MLFNIVLSKLYGVNKLWHQTIYCVIDHTHVLSYIHTFSNTFLMPCIMLGDYILTHSFVYCNLIHMYSATLHLKETLLALTLSWPSKQSLYKLSFRGQFETLLNSTSLTSWPHINSFLSKRLPFKRGTLLLQSFCISAELHPRCTRRSVQQQETLFFCCAVFS